MENTTKEKILDAALVSFAENGYKGTNLRNPAAGMDSANRLATAHFLSGTKDIYMRIFAEMMDNGILKKDDPEMLAFVYTARITALIHLCDREPEKEKEIRQRIKAFVHHFISTCGKTDGRP